MRRWIVRLVIVFCICVASAFAQDIERLGGDLSIDLGGYALQAAAPNVYDYYVIVQHVGGFGHFHSSFRKADGLGETFINSSCGGCHVSNGRGPLRLNKRNRESTAVVKVSLGGVDRDGAPLEVPGIGPQIQDRKIGGKRRFRYRLRWKKYRGSYPDGSKYELRSPRVRLRRGKKQLPPDTVLSLRMAPMIIGMGLLEAIPEESILAFSDPEDENGDGISGRPNYVPDMRYYGTALGRYGYKANHPSVEQQTAAAAFFDVGVSSELFKDKDGKAELSAETLYKLVLYQSSASIPFARAQSSQKVVEGKQIFQELNCSGCHKMNLRTGSHYFKYLEDQNIHPFTDLLLHDMGPGLSDRRPEFSASGSEWRTTPLWGIGLTKSLARKHRPRYLHDGRARNIEEAILWHGGEAEQSKRGFMQLTKEQRLAVLAFVRSL